MGLAVRCVGGGEPVGVARAIDARLDAVVATLPIREVLYQCLDSLEVRRPTMMANSKRTRHPSNAKKDDFLIHLLLVVARTHAGQHRAGAASTPGRG